MIVAYCDSCGEKIAPEVPAGVRYVIGKKEFSGHLCAQCQLEAEAELHAIHGNHPLRNLKSGSTT